MSASQISLPGQRRDDDSAVFPLVYAPDHADITPTETHAWIRQQAGRLVHLASVHGALLFRGFPVHSDEDFDAFVAAFGLTNFTYEDSLSNAVRTNRTERVFTANEAPADVSICLHHEMAQTPIYPSRLFFFCEQAAEQGGATPLCRSDVLYARMQQELPEFTAHCAEQGLLYSHVMPDQDDAGSGMGRSWRSTWNASTRAEAERRMAELDYSWQWQEDGCLKVTTPVIPAVMELADGRTTFFNQLIAAFAGWKDSRNDPSRSITFGDGARLDAGIMDQVIAMAEELTYDTPWQTGDVALVDNFVAMHGRRTFTGTRKVLASLVAS